MIFFGTAFSVCSEGRCFLDQAEGFTRLYHLFIIKFDFPYLHDKSRTWRKGTSSPWTMVTVIHVKDSFCTDISGKLNEIVNLRNGHWLPLNKYYSSGDMAAPGGTCVTCREGEVARLLLPCRHACLCDGCIAQMEGHCPMCGCEASSSVHYLLMVCYQLLVDADCSTIQYSCLNVFTYLHPYILTYNINCCLMFWIWTTRLLMLL